MKYKRCILLLFISGPDETTVEQLILFLIFSDSLKIA